MCHDKVDEIIEEFLESIIYRNQVVLKTSTKGSEFVFDWVHLLYYKCHC